MISKINSQNYSQTSITNAIEYLYAKLMTDAINEIKNNLKPTFHHSYLWVSIQTSASV